MNETVFINCKICGKQLKGLTLHLLYKHNLKPEEYQVQFPGAPIFSSSVKAQMKENSAWAKNAGKSHVEIYGAELAASISQKISHARSSNTGWKQPEKMKEKMKETWDKKRDEWCKSIRESAQTPERRETMRKATKKRIAEQGYHLARGRKTKLEKFVEKTIENMNLEFIYQKGTKKQTLGTVRFFDFYIPSLNLIIEADGEFWHRQPDRVEIDIAKTQAALDEGYRFLRISDKLFSRDMSKTEDTDLLIELIQLDQKEQLELSNAIISDRVLLLEQVLPEK